MALDFTKLAPWKNIETVTLDGEEMVRIPKFYVKVGTAPAGTDQSGKKCWWVSPTARKGYHVHPAFMHKGEELDQFYIGAYEAYSEGSNKAGSAKGKSPWVSITFDQSQAACEAHNRADGTQTGWHLQNLYERSAVALLCMLEIGSPDAQGKIGAGNSSSNAAVATGSSNASWRGIHEFWGNVWEWCDGFKTASDGKTILVHDNKGYGNYINTGISLPVTTVDECGINAMQDATGEGFDLSDMFIPSQVNGTAFPSGAASATFRDGYWMSTGDVRALSCGGDWGYGASCGLFATHTDAAPSYSGANAGLRLAKW